MEASHSNAANSNSDNGVLNLPNNDKAKLGKSTYHAMMVVGIILFSGCLFFSACYWIMHLSHSMHAMFDLDREANIPTWFAGILWFLISQCAFCAFLLERKQQEPQKFSAFWLVIAAAFLAASCDEVSTIHEKIGEHVDWFISAHSQSWPIHSWLPVYLGPLAFFGIAGTAFLWQRFVNTKPLFLLFVIAVACFCTSLILEIYQGSGATALWHLSILIEETAENFGCTCLILSFGGYAHHLYHSSRTR